MSSPSSCTTVESTVSSISCAMEPSYQEPGRGVKHTKSLPPAVSGPWPPDACWLVRAPQTGIWTQKNGDTASRGLRTECEVAARWGRWPSDIEVDHGDPAIGRPDHLRGTGARLARLRGDEGKFQLDLQLGSRTVAANGDAWTALMSRVAALMGSPAASATPGAKGSDNEGRQSQISRYIGLVRGEQVGIPTASTGLPFSLTVLSSGDRQ
jgi:hypothetical protein